MFCPRAGLLLANSGSKAAPLPKGRSYTTNSGTNVAVLLGMNRCGSFPLLSATYSLWTDLKRFEKIPAWRRGEYIWLSGPSDFSRNSPQGLNFTSIRVFDQMRDPEIAITLWAQLQPKCLSLQWNTCPWAELSDDKFWSTSNLCVYTVDVHIPYIYIYIMYICVCVCVYVCVCV